jgi:predicted RNA-binding Zn ribbon-like protein
VSIPRRRRRAKKTAKALGRVITHESLQLGRLMRLLNQRLAGDIHTPVREQVVAVITASAAFAYPSIPRLAGELFEVLAAGQTFTFTVARVPPDHAIVMSEASTEEGEAALELFRFFQNPARSRLRCCQQCGTWFIDVTRNQSARRCSRACTIAWSNAQRTTKGDPRP